MPSPAPLDDEQAARELLTVPGWQRRGAQISRDYKFAGFPEAVAFVNRVAALAESADHHPDILIRYNKVGLTLSTHSAGGLTAKDFDLARAIDSGAAK